MKINRLLHASLLFNALLAGGVFIEHHRAVPAATPPAFPSPQPVEAQAELPSAASSPQPPAPFSWNQVESPDYSTYIANLRAVACPEPTIRDIITADVANLYRRQRSSEQALARSGKTSASVLQQRLHQLDIQEAQVLVNLLGPPPEEQQVAAAQEPLENTDAQETSKIEAMAQSETQQKPVVLPLVFTGADAKLDKAQQQEIKGMIAEFTEAIGGPNQNPNDPAYLERWRQAQRDFDELLMAKFGDETYNALVSSAWGKQLK